tara:strand:+ start:158 stop:478 length:321 start_codon:yes stop_codon:yes gene_type:complete
VVVRVSVANPLDSSLNDHLGAQQAWERCRVNSGPHALLPSSLHYRRLFGMETDALIQIDSLLDVIITPLAPALIAINQPESCAVVPGRYDSIIFRDYRAIASFHAV